MKLTGCRVEKVGKWLAASPTVYERRLRVRRWCVVLQKIFPGSPR